MRRLSGAFMVGVSPLRRQAGARTTGIGWLATATDERPFRSPTHVSDDGTPAGGLTPKDGGADGSDAARAGAGTAGSAGIADAPWLASDAGRARKACVQKSTDGPWSSQKWQSATMPFMAASSLSARQAVVARRTAPASFNVLNHYRQWGATDTLSYPLASRFDPTTGPYRGSTSAFFVLVASTVGSIPVVVHG